jgi:hypothetical protein
MTTSPNDYTGQLLSYLQAWRQYLEQATSTAPPWPTAPNATPPGQAWPAPSWPVFPTPPMPPVPPPPAATSPAATSPAGPLTPSPGAVSPAPSEVVPPDDKQGGFYPRQPAGTALWTAGELSRESGRESLYSADMTTVPSEPMADPKPGSAYLEAGEPLHDSRSAPSETRSLYSDPGASPSPPTSWEPDRGMDRLGRDLEFGVLPNQTFSVSGTLPAGVVGGGEPGKPVKNDHAPGPPGIQEGFELNRLSVRNKNQ